MKYPNMECFIGTGFDCEFSDSRLNKSVPHIAQLEWYDKDSDEYRFGANYHEYRYGRPRLNHPTVLDDWSWVEGLEGFVWKAEYYNEIAAQFYTERLKSGRLAEIDENDLTHIISCSFIGTEKGSGLEEWARSVDVPILEVS